MKEARDFRDELFQGNIVNAAQCKKSGSLECGVCTCNDGFYGKHCECRGNDAGGGSTEDCRAANETVACSGHGVCKCGVCDCARRPNPQEVFFGKYCQCDNFSCKRSGGLVSKNIIVARYYCCTEVDDVFAEVH